MADNASSGSASTTLTSSIADPLRWFGTGTSVVAWTSTGNVSYQGSTLFLIPFQVTEPVRYSFEATLFHAYSNPELPSSNFAVAEAFLSRSEGGLMSSSVFLFRSGPENPSMFSPTSTGTLGPGEYRLLVEARPFGSGRGMASGTALAGHRFAMAFNPVDAAPVPEPTSMLLLGTGLAGLLGYRRRPEKRIMNQ